MANKPKWISLVDRKVVSRFRRLKPEASGLPPARSVMDANLNDVKSWLNSEGFTAGVAPAWLIPELKETTKLEEMYPYVVPVDWLSKAQVIILHKGFMHRLDPQVGIACISQWQLSFGNDVYCCFTKPGNAVGIHGPHRKHAGPILEWLGNVHPNTMRARGTPVRSAVIASAYGAGNVGDDLVTLATEHMLRSAGVEKVTCPGPFVRFEAIQEHDAVVLGGGGILYDGEARNLENYMHPVRTASRMGKATAALGVGTQGLVTEMGRLVTGRNLLDTGYVSVRSERDVEILAEIEPKLREKVERSIDLGFYLAEYLRQRAVPPSQSPKPIIVSLASTTTNPGAGERSMEAITNAVVRALSEAGKKVVLGLHSEDDRTMYNRVADANPHVAMMELNRLGPVASASIFADAAGVITSRFHGLIYASIFNKPVVSISRGQCKIRRFVESDAPSLLPQTLNAPDFEVSEILERFEGALPPNRDEIAACEKRAQDMAANFAAYLAQA